MATVVAVVDLARLRQPVHGEGGGVEVEEAGKVGLRQEAAAAGWTTSRVRTAAQEPPLLQVR